MCRKEKQDKGDFGGFITWEAVGQLKEEHSISVFIFSFFNLFLLLLLLTAKVDAKRPGVHSTVGGKF